MYPGRLTAAAITVTKMHTEVASLRDTIVGSVSRILWVVLGAVALLLLLACANVANLFLARAEGRQREFAVRRALGAGRILLLQTSLGEAIVLSAAGGVAGIALAAFGVTFLQQVPMGASIPRLGEVHVDLFVVAFTIVVSGIVALAVSALPAIRLSRASLSSLMGADGRSATGSRVRHGVRRALVVSQVALALVLVSGAALFARSFQRLSAVNPGFDADHALAFRLTMPAAAYPTTNDAADDSRGRVACAARGARRDERGCGEPPSARRAVHGRQCRARGGSSCRTGEGPDRHADDVRDAGLFPLNGNSVDCRPLCSPIRIRRSIPCMRRAK